MRTDVVEPALPDREERSICLTAYGGDQDTIPFVYGELAALRRLHQAGPHRLNVGVTYEALDEGGHELLHLACHGVVRRDHRGERVALHIAPGCLLDEAWIMKSRQSFDQVLIAACVGGRVREALDGEPSGLVGAFLCRGAREVVASVVALPDGWTMIVTLLIHQAWQRTSDLATATLEGKRRLSSGDWFPDTEAVFIETATDALVAWERRRLEVALSDLNDATWTRLTSPLTVFEPDHPLASLKRLRRAHGRAFQERIPDLAREAVDALASIWPASLQPNIAEIVRQRVLPEPILGTLVHGLRIFGNARGSNRQGASGEEHGEPIIALLRAAEPT